MEIISKKDGNKATMEIIGWLDTQTAPQLEEELVKLEEEITSLVFDFAQLEYISSAGLRQVVAAYKKMADSRLYMLPMKFWMSLNLQVLIKKLILNNEKIIIE